MSQSQNNESLIQKMCIPLFSAKIRVEQIIREDYLVEAMELLEMYCDLLLARFGLIQQMKTLDDGLAEAISSLIWVAPRMQADVARHSKSKLFFRLASNMMTEQPQPQPNHNLCQPFCIQL